MFESLPNFTPDPILALIDSFGQDKRPEKIDLGVGVYKDRSDLTPIMGCVKEAEGQLCRLQTTKAYLGAAGNREFSELLSVLVLGNELQDQIKHRTVVFQTVGGTGAVRLAADLIAATKEKPSVWIGTPTWANHFSIFSAAGVEIKRYVYCAPLSADVDFSAMLEAATSIRKGDAFLIHACCHNPTGIDLNDSQTNDLLSALKDRGGLPIVDCAYAGFGDGFEPDLKIVRRVLSDFDEAIVSFSCSKNFGLYRDRVGIIIVKAKNEPSADKIKLGLASIARSNYSMPPDHGAAVVASILGSAELKAKWVTELDEIRTDLKRKRERLASYRINTPLLKDLDKQRGMFSLLPITPKAVETLKDEFGIYMASNGRINVLGVPDSKEGYLVDCLSKVALTDPL